MAAVLDLDLVTVVKRRAYITTPGGRLGQGSEGVEGGERTGRGLKLLGFPANPDAYFLEKLRFELNYLILGAEYFCFPFL
jgi:hypothetical protein